MDSDTSDETANPLCRADSIVRSDNEKNLSTKGETLGDKEYAVPVSKSAPPTSKADYSDDEVSNTSDLSGLTDFKLDNGDDFKNNDIRMGLVDSVVKALENIGTGIDHLRNNCGHVESAIDLVEKRFLRLKEKEKEAKKDMETVMELLSRHSSVDKLKEFDNVILKIQEEIKDVEAQEAIMKMGSLKMQVELDGINGAHTNARTIIAKALFHYETIYREHLEEIKNNQESSLLKEKVMKNEIHDVLDENTNLKMKMEYLEQELEQAEKINAQQEKKATEMQDLFYENKILREQLRSAKQELQLSEKRQGCVTTALKEDSESMAYCSNSLVQNIREFMDDSCTAKSPLRERRNTNKIPREFVDDDYTAATSLRGRSVSKFSARRTSRRE
eukprot:CAMPEP_0194268786 /NCGR_PEP_ID=MMETSP0169-20130528/3044_1 /TAXON_ID=218684 /ORGANISM="Corethron pennatum, Strain L29A3" /LENGTH=387 /DNA_ID=CAMNT_0039010163 /DNA_START=167 /DNA_END=1330 /DNA_ORIENTATION=+